MMKPTYRSINRKAYSLGDLIAIVNSCAKDSKETIAAVTDLLASGRVAIVEDGKPRKVRVAAQ